jgi:hypothetical protein
MMIFHACVAVVSFPHEVSLPFGPCLHYGCFQIVGGLWLGGGESSWLMKFEFAFIVPPSFLARCL